MVISEEEI